MPAQRRKGKTCSFSFTLARNLVSRKISTLPFIKLNAGPVDVLGLVVFHVVFYWSRGVATRACTHLTAVQQVSSWWPHGMVNSQVAFSENSVFSFAKTEAWVLLCSSLAGSLTRSESRVLLMNRPFTSLQQSKQTGPAHKQLIIYSIF